MSQEKRKHHFLPKKYLRGFVPDNEKSRIWEYRRSGGKYNPGMIRWRHNPSLTTINKNAGANEGEYALEVDGTIDFNTYENQLEKLEKPADIVFDTIRSRSLISFEQKEILADYIVLMIKRIPARSLRAKQIFPQVVIEFEKDQLPTILSNLDSLIDATRPEDTKKRTLLKEQRQIALDRIKDLKENGLPRDMELDTIVNAEVYKVRQAVISMRWQFFEAPPGFFYVTSDNPVHIFQNGIGLKQPYSELVFPISSKIALVGSYQNVREEYVLATSRCAKEINRRVISQALEFVYACKSVDRILLMLSKSKHRFELIY